MAEEGTVLVKPGADQGLEAPGLPSAAVIGQYPATDAAPLALDVAQTDSSGSSSGEALVVLP